MIETYKSRMKVTRVNSTIMDCPDKEEIYRGKVILLKQIPFAVPVNQVGHAYFYIVRDVERLNGKIVVRESVYDLSDLDNVEKNGKHPAKYYGDKKINFADSNDKSLDYYLDVSLDLP